MREVNKLESVVLRPVRCSLCGGSLVFEGGGTYSCIHCGNVELDNFGKVSQFLYENGPAPIIVIEQATGVEGIEIEKMLKEGRLQIPEPSEYYIKCEKCGCDIKYGRFCTNCIKELAGGIKMLFNSAEGKKPKRREEFYFRENEEPKVEGKMRYFTGRRKRI
jgi:hypothetical protein